MGYKPLYHYTLQIWELLMLGFGAFFSFSLVVYIFGAFLIKQLFHLHLLN